MIFNLLVLLAILSVALSFNLNGIARVARKENVQMSMNSKATKGLATLLSAVTLAWSPVHAAQYGGFGGNYAEVVNPKDAVLNTETASSDDVKAGRDQIKVFRQSIADIKSSLSSNSQVDVLSQVNSKLNAGSLRGALNKYNAAFSEDTQRGTDRLIRSVIQDISELQKEAPIKEGKKRSDTKVTVLNRRLDAAAANLDDILKFLP